MSRFTSRKFLTTLGVFFAALAVVFQGDVSAETVGALALATVAVVAYVTAEGRVDAAREGGEAAESVVKQLAAAVSDVSGTQHRGH